MPLNFDPQQLPPVSVDHHLPAVTLGELQAATLRARFRAPPEWAPEIVLEKRFNDRVPAHASVLVPLVQRDELTVLLTQRTAHLTDHPGQISFPGGRAEPEDVNEVATALREAQEEIGLAPQYVDVLGQLPTYTTGTGFIVTPVVALVRPGFSIQADPFEVAEVFEVPLAFLMDPANHRWHAAEFAGRRREFLSMPWNGSGADGHPRHYFVWGATAAMLRNLYRFLVA
ncbi:CoA pyrophosphatase [Rhizobacter sp. Root1221]|uniref:CoA pyrophosphatase n=1 Tax=Rhizobacter sp. Root1221 TaxID=1736433 RepID=UPI0006F7E631|nr:CoA pyrophosphatase [Rhizobacter sp. Root1221]KQV78755.1 DNA mismatch repair protein MutT [Rhizobacter sp. Root1221]